MSAYSRSSSVACAHHALHTITTCAIPLIKLPDAMQFLDSYKSVTLESMAQSFGVSVDFIDQELADFIVSNRLTAKIDKVAGVVETNRLVSLFAASCTDCCRTYWCPPYRFYDLHIFSYDVHSAQGDFCTFYLLMRACPCRPDAKNAQYQQTIRHGDLLLNRLQRLAKVVDLE
jgi:26S proteasome regulatory subunit N7